MEWFHRWFGEEYLLVYEHRDNREAECEVEGITGLLDLKRGDLILDLCCGPGRHDTFLVHKGGYKVYGLDFSMIMLKIAADAVPSGYEYPRYIRADARKLPFADEVFDCVLNLFTSFGYFEDAENMGLVAAMARVLKPGGQFLIDYLNPPKIRSELVGKTTREKEGMTITEEREINESERRVEKTITLTWDNTSQTFHESVRLYEVDDMLGMLESAGFKVKDVIGSMDGTPYGPDAERMILYGSKR